MDNKVTNSQHKYLQYWLNKVSRSFALVIPTVESPLSENLAVAYLICRIVDNIEDCANPFSWQVMRFNEFARLLEEPEQAHNILTHWDQLDWSGLTNDENRMMGLEGLQLWQIYAQIPPEPRAIVGKWALEMAKGMQAVKTSEAPPIFLSRNGVELPLNEDDYNQYCYYVAGTVGHMATELVIQEFGVKGEIVERLLVNSEACGRALQKTNIVKDFAKDISRGVSYLPDTWMQSVDYSPLSLQGATPEWRYFVLKNVLDELADSVEYVVELPETAVGYRRACLLSMFPAYQTILLAAKRHELLFTPRHEVKISRMTMGLCAKDAKLMALDGEGIRDYGKNIENEVDKAFNSSIITSSTIRHL